MKNVRDSQPETLKKEQVLSEKHNKTWAAHGFDSARA